MNEKELKTSIQEEIKQNIKGCIIRPSVAVIEIGDNEQNDFIIKQREELCSYAGIYFRHYKYEETTPELTIINKIKELNNDDYVNGIMIQLPIPEKYNEKRLLNTIINSKDIDGQTDINVGRLISGRKTITPTFTLAIMDFFKQHEIDLLNKEIVLVYNKEMFIRPLLNLLVNMGCTVTVCRYDSVDLKKHTVRADILISCVGEKDFITDDMVKNEAIVVDAGINVTDGKIYGDVNYKKVSKKASLITSENDGIFDLANAMFLKNIIFCYESKK